MSDLWSTLAALPLRVESYELTGHDREYGSFTRPSTLVHLHGDGQEGIGEDVVYDVLDQIAHRDSGPVNDFIGAMTLGEFCATVAEIDLFTAAPPGMEASRNYRRWAYESAALDLALRQAGASLADALEMPLAPITFVVSTRLDDAEDAAKVARMLGREPSLRFKLDPTDDWPQELITQLAALGVVDVVDMKGQYGDDIPFDVASTPETYERIITAFPHALIEDPRLTPELRETLRGHEDRVTWDAPIHSVDDILAREWTPKTVNMKPSRFGPLSRLFAAYDHIAANGMGAYSGGQTELGPGRGQVQYLASLFHPHSSNDIAPKGYNDPSEPDDLPGTPLPVTAAPTGFRWGD